MKRNIHFVAGALVVMLCTMQTVFAQLNALTDQEKKEGWQLLFDGKSLQGWKLLESGKAPGKGWEVKRGTMSILRGENGGDLVTNESYGNFELTLEARLTKGANSGVKYFIQPPCSVGFEYQVLDNDVNPDAKAGINGNRRMASLYDLLPAQNATPKPIGEWNQIRIIVQGNKGEHWLNGVCVLKIDRSSQTFRDAYNSSKFKEFNDFGTYNQGHIMLQDHGWTVSYRNIKIRPLP
jgi:hypothetical protein